MTSSTLATWAPALLFLRCFLCVKDDVIYACYLSTCLASKCLHPTKLCRGATKAACQYVVAWRPHGAKKETPATLQIQRWFPSHRQHTMLLWSSSFMLGRVTHTHTHSRYLPLAVAAFCQALVLAPQNQTLSTSRYASLCRDPSQGLMGAFISNLCFKMSPHQRNACIPSCFHPW